MGLWRPIAFTQVGVPYRRHIGLNTYGVFPGAGFVSLLFRGKLAGWTGLEPAAFRVTGGRYNQLNYHPARTALDKSAVCHRNQDL